MVHLHLLRHAKTNQHSDTGLDFDRALMPRGVDQSVSMCQFLQGKTDLKLDEVWVSTAKRTQQTYQLISESILHIPATHLVELYLASEKELLAALFGIKHKKNILLIGHNFGISNLAGYFLDREIELRTCEYVHLSFDVQSWEEVSGGLASLVDEFRPLD